MDAAAAVKKFNNVQLDGKPMKIEMVGTNIATPAPMPLVANGILGNPFGVLGRYPLLWPSLLQNSTKICSLKITTVLGFFGVDNF